MLERGLLLKTKVMKPSVDAESKKLLKFDSWMQNKNDITVILHAGRSLKANDLSVEFTDADVKVGLTDGRKWSCQFWQSVVKEKCKVQLRKMKIHLIITKKDPGLAWESLQQTDGGSCKGAAVSSTKQSEHIGMSITKSAPVVELTRVAEQPSARSGNSQGNKSNTVITNDSEPLVRSKSDVLHKQCEPRGRQQLLSGQTGGMAGDSALHEPVSDAGNDRIVDDFSVLSNNVQTPDCNFGNQVNIENGAPSHMLCTDIVGDSSEESVTGHRLEQASGSGEDGVRASQAFADLTASPVSMDCTSLVAEDNVHVLATLNHNFYETNDTIVVEIYVKKVLSSTLKVSFKPTNFHLIFQTSDLKFCESVGVISVDTRFSWSVELANIIDESKCKYKALSTKMEITLVKMKAVKWGCLQNISIQDDEQVAQIRQGVSSFSGKDVGAELTNVQTKESTMKNQPVSDNDQYKHQSSAKPTCRVTPLSSEDLFGNRSVSDDGYNQMAHKPGWTGLDNLGNTCFMNSVLQVLANTAELKAYFLEGHYGKDINTVNPLGMKGDMAKSFAQMVSALWSGTRSSFTPSKIKTLLAMKQTRFTGFLQHDAEEFMEFLLDGLHEDLNRIINKPYSEEESDHRGKPEQAIADEQWKTHLARNDSHIVDTFQGQFRSKLTCPVCKMVSVKFDPFSVLSVPIPKKKKLLNVIFMPRGLNSRPIKYQLLLDTTAKIKNVKDALHARTQVNPNQLRIMEVRNSRAVIVFDKDAKVSQLNEDSQIIARRVLAHCGTKTYFRVSYKFDAFHERIKYEVASSQLVGEPVKELLVQQSAAVPLQIPDDCSHCHCHQKPDEPLKRCRKCFRSAYCNQSCQKSDWPQHKSGCKWYRDAVGYPFIISLPVSQITYRNLYELLDSYARYSVNTFQPPSKCSLQSKHPAMDVSGPALSGTCSAGASEPGLELTLETMDVDESDTNQASDKAVRHVIGQPQNPIPVLPKPPFAIEIGQVRTDDDASSDRSTIVDRGDELYDLSSVSQLEMVWNNNDKSDPCVMVATKDLLAEVTEKPSSADKNQPVGLNDCLQLFCEPELLAADQTWKCPRCKLHCRATKELSVWRMPCNLIIQIKRFSFANVIFRSKIEEFVDFPIKSLDMGAYFKSVKTEEYDIGDRTEHLYDLYGVINHYGGMLGGHYTSFARTPDLQDTARNELGWRQFDDDKVTSIEESSVVTQAAYVLFYRRRELGAKNIGISLSAAASLPSEVPPIDDCDLESSPECDRKDDMWTRSNQVGESSSDSLKQRTAPANAMVYKWTDIEDID